MTPVRDYAIVDSSFSPDFDDDLNRPALAQSFMDSATGGIATVVVNHLKSKSCRNASGLDADQGDGQGCYNWARTQAANAEVAWLASDPTGINDPDYLVLGDLNSYAMEDPIGVFVDAGYVDLIQGAGGSTPYSYVFDGSWGYLDYALASPSLVASVAGTAEYHINSDEAAALDYNTEFKSPGQLLSLYAADEYRTSDHDPVIVGLDICDEIAPTIESITATPDVLRPANHKYVDVNTTVVASDNFDPNPTIELVEVVSSEPDNGVGDGNTVDDIVIVDDFTFKLRAERSGSGEGRTYTITYKVTDDCGNEVVDSVTVFVPLNRRGGR